MLTVTLVSQACPWLALGEQCGSLLPFRKLTAPPPSNSSIAAAIYVDGHVNGDWNVTNRRVSGWTGLFFSFLQKKKSLMLFLCCSNQTEKGEEGEIQFVISLKACKSLNMDTGALSLRLSWGSGPNLISTHVIIS